uniref:Uncharacterized protein n=1 Tax=Zea mays TaxID=4577 RepID=C4J551_MAIZE|nr:unknown [Zea mays]
MEASSGRPSRQRRQQPAPFRFVRRRPHNREGDPACLTTKHSLQEGLGRPVGPSRRGADGTSPRREGHATELSRRRRAPRR